MTIGVTGATGKLGRHVIDFLKARAGDEEIVALVRSPENAADLGVTVRAADYTRPETLGPALAGIDRLLLISANELGQRVEQHRNVIDAAAAAGVGLIAYTSLVDADASPVSVAEEHRQTEAMLSASGVPYVLLRNGWYMENHTVSVPSALAAGAFYGAGGSGRISGAMRRDYAEAAAVVLTNPGQAGKVYELAGDTAYTLADLAAEISRQTGRDIGYVDLSPADFTAALAAAGLPAPWPEALAVFDTDVASGGLYHEGKTLSQLIGHPTAPLAEAVAEAMPADATA